MRIDSPISCNAQITGSFTGSFKGDGTFLTGVTAEWDGSHNGDATITGSLTVAGHILPSAANTYDLGSATQYFRSAYISAGTINLINTSTGEVQTSISAESVVTTASLASVLPAGTVSGSAQITISDTTGYTAFSSSIDAHLDSNVTTLSTSISSLSSSAHTQRLAENSNQNAVTSLLSGSAHAQRVALNSAQTTALNSLSSSAATALRAEYVAADLTLSGSAHTQREAIKSLATSANNSLSSSIATSLRAEYVAADSALSASQKTYIDAKVAGIVDSAPGALDTLNELAAALGDDANFATTTATSIGEKLAKASNLSDLADAATARTNLGVDTKANTWTGVSGDVTISSLGVATVADDSHNHIISNIDGLQTALDAKQAAGTYNTIIGTDTDLDTTGAEVVDQINVTDGVIQSMSKRTLTLANLGYTGATDANNYTHPTYAGDDINLDTGALTGATVISDLDFNVTTDTSGHVTDANAAVSTRTLTLADLGYSGTTNANTYAITQDNTSNVHFEGLMVGQTTGATANTIRCVGDVVAYYSSDAQFKDNVETLEGALDKVKAIRGVRFDWNDKQDVFEGHDIGVIAQEVEAVLPELVHYREHNDSKAVDYVKLTAVLIEAVKELAAKVEELSK